MLFKIMEKMYRNAVYRRADADGSIFYFSAADFDGLQQKPFRFASSKGHAMQGYFYWYENYVQGRIIFVEHGMGSGHRGYMKEIERIARHGYLVFAYDHTGCMESGGETTGGFVQSLIDLNDAITAVKNEPQYKNADISVVGHSWGGFSTLNIAAVQPCVSRLVAMAGFVSVPNMLAQFFSGALKRVAKRLYEKEKAENPQWIDRDAVSALRGTEAKVLVLHSMDDNVVSFEKQFLPMKKALADKENISFVALEGKGHNPNYTVDAVIYKDAFFATYRKLLKKKKLKTDEQKKAFVASYDWDRMTEQDERVWEMIFKTLDT